MINKFHKFGRLVKDINPCFVVLIPEKEANVELSDYRPISLIGGIYKIISKILAKRMSCVLETIISDNSYASIWGRQILDNIVVLN